jgi:hypothetical protein
MPILITFSLILILLFDTLGAMGVPPFLNLLFKTLSGLSRRKRVMTGSTWVKTVLPLLGRQGVKMLEPMQSDTR